MKIECAVEKLKIGIAYAERITGKNLTLPVLNSILLIASGKNLRLRATNLSLGVEIEIPAKVEKEGVVAITGSILGQMFANVPPSENVTLDGQDGNVLVKTKKSRIKL